MTHCVRGPADPLARRSAGPDPHRQEGPRPRLPRDRPTASSSRSTSTRRARSSGDMSLLGQDRLPEAYAEAIDDGVICTITPDELRRLIERYPIIGVNIIRHLSRRLQAAERELEAMAYQRVDQRLARKLLDLGQRFGVDDRPRNPHPGQADPAGAGRDDRHDPRDAGPHPGRLPAPRPPRHCPSPGRSSGTPSA